MNKENEILVTIGIPVYNMADSIVAAVKANLQEH